MFRLEIIVAKTRVFEIARELGVTSKDVIAKCEAEDIPGITNHMSAVGIGLAATIREWFSGASAVSTAVETAAPVDVAAAQAKATKTKRKATRKKPEPATIEPTAAITSTPSPPRRPTSTGTASSGPRPLATGASASTWRPASAVSSGMSDR